LGLSQDQCRQESNTIRSKEEKALLCGIDKFLKWCIINVFELL
jgi:hypothetical protein